jgi:hypothetical protein
MEAELLGRTRLGVSRHGLDAAPLGRDAGSAVCVGRSATGGRPAGKGALSAVPVPFL